MMSFLRMFDRTGKVLRAGQQRHFSIVGSPSVSAYLMQQVSAAVFGMGVWAAGAH